MKLEQLRRLAILALFSGFVLIVAVTASSFALRGLEQAQLAEDTQETLALLRERRVVRQAAFDAAQERFTAQALDAETAQAAQVELEGSLRSAFQRGQFLRLTVHETEPGRLQADWHWRGDEEAFRDGLEGLALRLPHSGLSQANIRVVDYRGERQMELTTSVVQAWSEPR